MKKKEIDEYIKSKSVTQSQYVAPTVQTHVDNRAPAMVQVAQTVKPTVKSQPTNDVRTVKQPTLNESIKNYGETLKNSAVKNQGFNLSNAISDIANLNDATKNVLKSIPGIGNYYKGKDLGRKNAVNVATNMATGAIGTMEKAADAASDLVFNPIEQRYNYAFDYLTKGKKTADANLKDLKKMQERDIKKNRTEKLLEDTGYNDVVDELEEGSAVRRDNLLGQVAQGTGGMVPALVLGQAFGGTPELTNISNLQGKEKLAAALGNVGKTYMAQLPSNAVLGASSYGGGMEEALNDGASMNRARAYGLTNAGIEQLTEMLTGGVPGLEGKGGIDQFVEPLINRNTNGYLNALLRAGYGALGEGLEETTGTYLDALAKRGILGKNIDWNEVNKEALQSGLVGAATGAILNAPSTTQDFQNVRAENQIRDVLGDAEYAEGRGQYNPDYKGWENQREENRIENEKKAEERKQRNEEFARIQQEREEEARKTQGLAQEREKEQERLRQQEETNKALEARKTLNTEQSDYDKYYKKNNLKDYDSTITEKAKETIASNKQGRRTKQQWLDVANNIGMQLKGQDAETIKKYAYESFKTERPNTKDNLNRQGQKYVSFKVDEWVDTVQKAAQSQSSPEAVQSNVETKQQTPQIDNKVEQQIERFKERGGRVEDTVPEGFIKTENATTAPKGYTWYNNGKSRFGGEYENVLVKDNPQQKIKENIPAEMEKEPVLRVEKAKKEITNNLNEAIKGNKTQDFQTMKNNIEKETGRKMRSWVETSTKATGQTELVNSMNKEKITYEPTSNKKNLDNANKELAGLTYEQKLEKAKAIINSDKRLKSTDIALLETVTQESLKEGKMDDFMNLVQETAILGTESGQVVQALSLIRQSDPMTQIDTLKKLIEKEQAKGNKVYQGVEIKEDLVEKVMDSYKKDGTWNREQFDEAMDELKQDIANQMNVRPSEKLNAWRYLSMLGNPKTHIRNIVANIAMGVLQKGKNTIAASIETIAPINKLNKLLGGSETATRGKTLEKSTQEVKNYANNAIDNYFAEHKQKSKYNETMGNLKGELESRRKIFNDKNQVGKMLNKLEKANSNALDIEDVVFNKATTKKAFSNFLTANGIETQQDIENNPEIVAQGLEYAIFKGQEATFHQYSQTGTTLRNARESLRQGSNLTRIVGLGMDATMPFINTPLNIAKTGIEYTPGLGMIKTISDVNNASVDMKADVLIDSVSKQFAGGTLAAIGYFLAKAGILNGKGGDEKKDKLEKNLGKQDYSINIGDNTYDLSWLSPSAMPLFVGVELEKTLKGKQGIDFNTVMDALTKTIDPLSEMSVVSSITDALQSYSQGTQALQDISTSAFTSYISQYFPTLLGQIATLFDEKQRSSYGQTTTEKLINQIKYKIPGLKNTLPEQVTAWGEEKKNSENVLIRATEAFLSPANRKDVKIDDTTREIERIYDNTGSGLPSLSLTKSPKIDSDYVGLNSDEYTQYKKDYGKTSKKILDELVELKNYKEATDEEKRKMISAIYDYSTYMARKKIADDKDIKYEYKQSDGTGYNYPKYYLSLNVDSFAEYVAEKYNKEEE